MESTSKATRQCLGGGVGGAEGVHDFVMVNKNTTRTAEQNTGGNPGT